MRYKQLPEDFLVDEIIELPLMESGDYCYIRVQKKNWTTTRLVEALANRLRINPKAISYAGLKDKDGITTQLISCYKPNLNLLKKMRIKDVELKIIGFGDQPIKMGSHTGNTFTLVIRDLSQPLTATIKQFPNYYDDQRFGGTIRPISHKVGKAIIEGKYEEAVKTLLLHPFAGESKDNKVYRQQLKQSWPHCKNIIVPKHLYDERRVVQYIQDHPGDWEGAIRQLQKRLLTLCIHAHQSYNWNSELSKLLATEECAYIQTVIGKLAISLQQCKDCFIPLVGLELPKMNMRTLLREAFIVPDNFQLSKATPDTVNKGKLQQTVSFSLPKGSYATTIVKCLAARTNGNT